MGCVFPKAVRQPIPASLRIGSDGRLKVLESQVRTHIVAERCGPTIGFLHTYNVERPPLVLDLMEPQRPIVDRKVLEFVQAHTFHPADFTIRSDGVCRLNPEIAKHVIAVILPEVTMTEVRLCQKLKCRTTF
jgi:CRISPR/Cas system-associated endonuclease Cas1